MNHEKKEFLEKLTMSDLAQWAGSQVLSRGYDYQQGGRVNDLALCPDGGLVAWVFGTWQYATYVDVSNGNLISQCTCPYGERCKHAVAVVLQYAEEMKNKKPLKTVNENDERLVILKDNASGTSLSKPENDKSYDEYSFNIDTLSLEDARAMLKSIAYLYPETRKYLMDRFLLSSGNVDKIVSATEHEIYDLTFKPAWANHGEYMDELPDYSEVRKRFEILLSSGHYDEVLRLGRTLLKQCTKQVDESYDEGETEEEIAGCMDIVFKALQFSSMSNVEKMQWAVLAELDDEFNMTRGSEEFWLRHFESSDWSALADSLMTMLADTDPVSLQSNSDIYERDRLTNWIIKAMDNSGRDSESLSLCLKEAEKTHSYVRLVERLINAGMHGEAEEWIHRGLNEAVDSLSGNARKLRGLFQKIKEKEGDWISVASLLAEEYTANPGIKTYEMLEKTSEKTGVWSPVRQHILHFLETGLLPGSKKAPDEKNALDVWPLPKTGLKTSRDPYKQSFPMYHELIEVAIYEKNPSEVLRWYDLSLANHQGREYNWNFPTDELKVARAVFGEYPDSAISMFRRIIEDEIAQTNRKSYEMAVSHLTELGKLMQEKSRKQEWDSYISDLRRSNSNKPRFLKTLNTISEKRIIDL